MIHIIFVVLILAILVGMGSAAGILPRIDTPSIVTSVKTTMPSVSHAVTMDTYGAKCDVSLFTWDGQGWTCPR